MDETGRDMAGENEEGGVDRKFVTALSRGLEVLGCFQQGERLLGNNQIAERTGLPKATVTRLTYTLTGLGYLNLEPGTGKYRLGPTFLRLGYSMLAQMDVRRIARPLMQALAEHTQASVNLGTCDHLSMVYIDTYRNTSTYAVQLDVGSQLPLATTSMGRAYLCGLDEAGRAVLLEQLQAASPANWPVLRVGIERALQDYREKGYCMSLGDWRTEVHAIAVPLVPTDGSPVMVFSCSGASFQLRRDVLEGDIGPRLLNLVGNVRTALARL